MDSHEKSSTISRVYRCCCNFFSSISSTISMILCRNVSLSRGKSTTRFAVVTVFPKWKFSLGVKKHTFSRRNSTKQKFVKVSPFINNYSFRIIITIQQQQHIATRKLWSTSKISSTSAPTHILCTALFVTNSVTWTVFTHGCSS